MISEQFAQADKFLTENLKPARSENAKAALFLARRGST